MTFGPLIMHLLSYGLRSACHHELTPPRGFFLSSYDSVIETIEELVSRTRLTCHEKLFKKQKSTLAIVLFTTLKVNTTMFEFDIFTRFKKMYSLRLNLIDTVDYCVLFTHVVLTLFLLINKNKY
jgi:hypothetical protein